MEFEIIEYLDFLMGFLTCGAISLALYLILSRKKK